MPPELTAAVTGALALATLREQGVPYGAAVMMSLRIAFAACLVAALMGGNGG